MRVCSCLNVLDCWSLIEPTIEPSQPEPDLWDDRLGVRKRQSGFPFRSHSRGIITRATKSTVQRFFDSDCYAPKRFVRALEIAVDSFHNEETKVPLRTLRANGGRRKKSAGLSSKHYWTGLNA